ncbi:MAG: GGDEF domain-containing protein [Treponema sp.]|nr:GGDEF domain-containing protein [Treponema sp.]
MRFSVKKVLGIEKPRDDIQFILDCANIRNSRIISLIIMIMEIITFSISFGFEVHIDPSVPNSWMFHHRIAYVILFTAAAQLFFYTITRPAEKGRFTHKALTASIAIFLTTLAAFANYVSILDYVLKEQILVFVTLELLLASIFMLRPVFSVTLITLSFGFFYWLMKKVAGVSPATNVNYPILYVFFVIVNIARYYQYLKIARQTVMNHTLAESLRESSLTDALTKLRNRAALKLRFEEMVGSQITMMLTDIDDFKTHNDTRGHNYGDELLVSFARILQNEFGKQNCFRYGGDEYLVMIPQVSKEEFKQKIKNCVAAIDGAFKFSGGCSNGAINSIDDLSDFIKEADKKLYQAKRRGKNRVLQ